MRHFIRHPTEIPIEITASDAVIPKRRLVNVSLGGLAFRADRPYAPRSTLKLKVGCVSPPFETEVQVVWCQPVTDGYDIGAAFLAPQDAFTARMVEQICRIEEYAPTSAPGKGARLPSTKRRRSGSRSMPRSSSASPRRADPGLPPSAAPGRRASPGRRAAPRR